MHEHTRQYVLPLLSTVYTSSGASQTKWGGSGGSEVPAALIALVPALTLVLLTLKALVEVLALVLVLALVTVVLYVERFMHHFGGSMLVPQCVILECGVRAGPSKSKHV